MIQYCKESNNKNFECGGSKESKKKQSSSANKVGNNIKSKKRNIQ